MAESIDVFVTLEDAVTQICQGFEKIVELAPDRKLYGSLLESLDNPFIKGLLKQNGKDIDLKSDNIRFAVFLKELYDNGDLEMFKSLINKDFENFEKLKSKSKNVENHVVDDTKLKNSSSSDNVDTVRDGVAPEQSILNDENQHTNENNEKEDTEKTKEKENVDNDNINNEEIKKEEDDEEANMSEVFTSSVVRFNISDNNNTDDNIYKRNRKFEIFKEDKLPELPEVHNKELIAKVFTHSSVLSNLNIPEESKVNSHNERIEFLGDAFLQFITSMIIYERFPTFSEGQLSILRSKLVSNTKLLKFSQLYGFDKQLRKNFNDSSVLNNKMYADVFEAYLGAIAEEQMMESMEGETNVGDFMKGWFNAKNWIEELCEEEIRLFDPSIVFKMQYSKSSKQDLRLLIGINNIPDYVRCNIGNRRFLSCVKISHKVYGYGIGTSNKEADSRAATDALANPGIRKICPDDVWKKFEDSVGLDSTGALNFEQFPTKVSNHDMELLKKEIALKYKNGNIKLLASKNNPISLLIGDKEREIAKEELESKHSLENTSGELIEDGSNGKNSNSGTNTPPVSAKKSKDTSSKYYSKEYTMGRGGIFAEEYGRILKGTAKRRGGISRNCVFEIFEETHDGSNSSEIIKLRCHEVLEKCDEIDMDSKNQLNALFAKRGGAPGYISYKTISGDFLCELWFGNKQIVAYGLDKNKRMSSQKAAMLALKREEYYDNTTSEESGSESGSSSGSESESNSDSDSASDSGSDSDSESD